MALVEAILKDISGMWEALRGMGMYPEVVIFSFGIFKYMKWYKKWDSRKASPIVFVASILGNFIYTHYQGAIVSKSWTLLMGINIGMLTLAIHYILKKYKILDKYFKEEK